MYVWQEQPGKKHLVSEWRPGVRVVELLCENWQEQDDNAEQHGKPEVGGVHTVERDALVVVREEVRVSHQGHDEVRRDRAPDKQVIDAAPEIRLQATLQRKRNAR